MADRGEGGRAPLRGDEAELFRDFKSHVRTARAVADEAPRAIVDDACGFAWQQFMGHQPERDRNWRGWMITTAEREVWRLREIEASHLSLTVGEESAVWDVPDRRDQLAIRTRLREALGALAEVPARRRDVKALQTTGFSYEEICELRGLTYTRVNRMIAEANAVLREEQGREQAAARRRASPRAERLRELETTPPRWLRSAIGRLPALTGDPSAVLAWRRAAIAIDDYRRVHGRRAARQAARRSRGGPGVRPCRRRDTSGGRRPGRVREVGLDR
jgi:DNA-directed RNA polymerase specialized sigma24 family protein